MASPAMMRIVSCCLLLLLLFVGGPPAAARETFYVRSPRQVERMVTKVIRKQINQEREEAKEKGENPRDVRFSGFGPGSPLHKQAENEARERGTLREHTMSAHLATALLPQIDDQVMLAIAAGPTAGAPALLGSPEGSEDESGGGDDAGDMQLSIPEHRVAAYKESVALVDDVATGAIANTGALPRDAEQWMDMAAESIGRNPTLRSHDVHWLLATSELEHNDTEALEDGEETLVSNEELDADLAKWFEEGGGSLTYVEVDSDKSVLRAKEDLNEGEVVIKMPLKLTLSQISARNVRTRGGYLGQHMKDLFKMNQRWGLAMMLLHEHFKDTTGKGSKWGPFLRTLRVAALTKPIMQEIKGTYASQVYRRWEEDSDELSKWVDREHFCLQHGLCSRNKNQHAPGSFTKSDIRWAMWVVRRFGLQVTKKTTGKPFLALVPYSHLLQHHRGTGGSVFLEMDNTVRIAAGNTLPGDVVGVDMGPMGDAEHFLKFHRVQEEENEDNHVHVSLPGRGGSRDDMFWQLDTLRRWRKELGLPPRMSDLWRITESLHLFGDDEEEQNLLSRSNMKVAGLPFPTDQITAEEQLMLYNGLDANEAQLMVAEVEGEPAATLYSAPDPEEDERAKDAMDDLAAAVLQLQRSVGLGQVDNATLTVINKTKNFLEHGVMPWKGLDEVDQLLLRKLSILKQCGDEKMHRINAVNVSENLLCALRVHLVNQTDMEVVCPKADGPWFEPKCEDDSFNATMPVSLENELATLQALTDSINVMLAGYTTDMAQDEDLLRGTDAEAGGNGFGPTKRAAVLMRLREKQLLHTALEDLEERRSLVNENVTFQVDLQSIALARKAKEHAEQKARMERLLAEALAPKISVQFPVQIDGGQDVNLTIMEREVAEVVVRTFVANHSLPSAAYTTLLNEAMKRGKSTPPLQMAMPVITPDGMRRVLTVTEGQNVTDEALRFCMMWNVTEEAVDRIVQSAEERHKARLSRAVLVTVPVTGLDGRKLQLQVRQGEQHSLYTTVLDFCTAYGMPENVVLNLANEVNRRLPNVLFELPVNPSGSVGMKMRVSVGDQGRLEEVVRGFCEVHGLPLENVPVLLRQVRAGLNPGAMVL